MEKIQTISLFVANKPGVLLRVCLVFARRAYNIESLVVSSALDGRFSRMTITAKGDPKILEQIINQLNKLIDIVHASEHTGENCVDREMALIKVATKKNTRTEVLQVVAHFKAQTIDLCEDSIIVQITGNTKKLDAMVALLKSHGIIELVRSGKMVMARRKEET